MKKLLALSLALVVAAGLLSGCGCTRIDKDLAVTEIEEGTPAEGAAESASSASPEEGEKAPEGENAETPAESKPADVELPAVSENKEVVKKENAPKVVMIKDPKDNVDSLTYHLEGCKKLEGKESQEVSWEMIQMVGFWQCPECNPPRYEDYKNAQ